MGGATATPPSPWQRGKRIVQITVVVKMGWLNDGKMTAKKGWLKYMLIVDDFPVRDSHDACSKS